MTTAKSDDVHDPSPASALSAPAQADPTPTGRLPRLRRLRRRPAATRYTLPGACGALLFACLSFTPSLLPRSGVTQGVVCGVDAAIGYGLGVLAAAIWRTFPDRPPRPARPAAWRAFAVVAVLALTGSVAIGEIWQSRLRVLMGTAGPGVATYALLPLLAVGLFVGLLALARAVRALYRWIQRRLRRWMGPRAARGLGWVLVVGGTVLLVNGVLLAALSSLADRAFAVRDTTTTPETVRPTIGLRSGGPASLVAWDTLGRQGRRFVGTGPTRAQIADFTGRPAQDPIRVYVGTSSAAEPERRAQLAVEDLQRAGAFDRRYLLLANTTGSGWVNAGLADTFEYLTGGDSAVVATQYSHLPSWISYLVDQKPAREAGRDLFDAVYDHWSSLPAARRPRLLVAGESLGSFGGEAAFSGAQDMRNRTAGALFTGPPNFNPLYREFTDGRDPGTPEVQPVYRQGRIVRFSNDIATGAPPTSRPWAGARVLYLQHASDPITWWSTRLALHRPDWLREPRGRDVLPQMHWIPFVTFWQVVADLPLAAEVPDGHGHSFTTEYVDGWASVLQPPGWSAAKADQLRQILGG